MGNAQEDFRLFDTTPKLMVTKGGYQPASHHTTPHLFGAEVNAFKVHMRVMLVFLLLVYAVSILITMNCTTDGRPCNVALSFMLFHFMFMFGIPYLLLKKKISRGL
jgi:hypothetical protein